jgi:vanillate O-demethylase monooxygenase subunit
MLKGTAVFLRNQWYIAAEAREVGREPLGRIILDEPVVLYRKTNGTPVALEDRCCHRRAPLHKGRIEGDAIRCGYHGFLYDGGGACIQIPGQVQVPPGARVRSYPVCERHRWVWIWTGEPALADPALIPGLDENDDPAWVTTSDYLHVRASYLLLVDNLLDLSHLAFVHSGTIGSAGDLNPDLTFKRDGDIVRGTRIVRNIPPPPHVQRSGFTANVDQAKIMTFRPPSTIPIEVTTTETGRKPGMPGNFNFHIIIYSSMTPETETSCHYFWALARDFDITNGEFTDFYHREVIRAFNEDKEMLEAQQRIIDLDPAAPTVDVRGDVGGLQARRIVERLIAAEASGQRAAAE